MAEFHPIPTHPLFQDLTGNQFGRLTAIAYLGKRNGAQRWRCECKCGKTIEVQGGNLATGHTKSCGCFRREVHRRDRTTHGMFGTPEYRVWASMLTRCHNPKCMGFANYGGRGITVCERWRESFEAFYADMRPRPSPAHSIERTDNDGNYEKTNCRWVTSDVQVRNKRNNHWITFRGKTMLLADWARFAGMSKSALLNRLLRGWSVERAVTEPVRIKPS